MVGRELSDRFPKRSDVKVGDICMEVKDWNVYHPLYTERKVVDNVSINVRKGEVVGISGLIMTKLDGTAKGGILIALAQQFQLPVYALGVGEKVDDLRPFSAEDYVHSLLGETEW